MLDIASLLSLAEEYNGLKTKLNGDAAQSIADESQASDLVQKFLQHTLEQFLQASDRKPFCARFLAEVVTGQFAERGLSLPAKQFVVLKLSDAVFQYIFKEVQLDPVVVPYLFPLKVVFIRRILDEPDLLEEDNQILYQMLEMLVQLSKYVDKYAGERGVELLKTIFNLSVTLAQADDINDGEIETALIGFNDFIGKFRAASGEIESNIIQNETKELAEANASAEVHSELAEYTEGEELPTFVVDFIQSVWSKYLKLTLLQHGKDSDTYQQALEDIRVLVWSITGPFDELFHEQFMSIIPETMKRLFLCLDSMHYDKDAVGEFFHSIESLHADVLAGRRITVDTIIVASIFDEFDEAESTVREASELDGGIHSKFRRGDWIKLTFDENTIICKILAKYKQPDKVIFVNVSGDVVKILPNSEFEKFNQTQISAIKQTPVVEPALRYSESLFKQNVSMLRNRYRDLMAEQSKEKLKSKLDEIKVQAEQEKKELERKEQEQRIKEEARRRWEAEKKRLEEEEKLKEEQLRAEQARIRENERRAQEAKLQAERLQAQNAQRESQAAEQARSKIEQEKSEMEDRAAQFAREKEEMERRLKQMELEKAQLEAKAAKSDLENQRLSQEAKKAEEEAKRIAKAAEEKLEKEKYEKRCLEHLDRIVPGTWMEIVVEDKPLTCKLGLVLQSTKKMIFVDRAGAQVFGCTKPQLLELMLAKKAKVLEFGVEFESTLESLVKSRREKLSDR